MCLFTSARTNVCCMSFKLYQNCKRWEFGLRETTWKSFKNQRTSTGFSQDNADKRLKIFFSLCKLAQGAIAMIQNSFCNWHALMLQSHQTAGAACSFSFFRSTPHLEYFSKVEPTCSHHGRNLTTEKKTLFILNLHCKLF